MWIAQLLAHGQALARGTTDPTMLTELARGRLRGKLPALRAALAGRFRTHHEFLVGQLLTHLDYLDEAIVTLSMGRSEVHRGQRPGLTTLRPAAGSASVSSPSP